MELIPYSFRCGDGARSDESAQADFAVLRAEEFIPTAADHISQDLFAPKKFIPK
jgi:hypothetical protein